MLKDPYADNPEDRLPSEAILMACQMSDDPELQALTPEHWFQIENCLKKPIYLRRLPRYTPAVIRPSDQRFTLNFFEYENNPDGSPKLDADGFHSIREFNRKFMVRKMDSGDVMDIASIGPQLIETFFEGSIDEAAKVSLDQLVTQVLARSMGDRFKLCMHELGENVLIKACSLAIDVDTKAFLTKEELEMTDPVQGQEALQKILSTNTLFFSTLTQQIPEPIRDLLRYLIGMISWNGNPLAGKITMSALKKEY